MAMNMAVPAMATVSAAATMVTATNTTMTTATTSDYDWSAARHESHCLCPMSAWSEDGSDMARFQMLPFQRLSALPHLPQ